MFFQLLAGMHREIDGTVYRVKTEASTKDGLVPVHQPIVESACDLVAKFGANKFRRISDTEAESLLGSAKKEKSGLVVVKSPGRDVTEKFPGAKNANLKVYLRRKGAYLVFDSNDDPITAEGPINREALEELLEQFSE